MTTPAAADGAVLSEEERALLRDAPTYIDVGDDRTGKELAVERILGARLAAADGLRADIEALVSEWDRTGERLHGTHSAAGWFLVANRLRTVLARHPAEQTGADDA